MANLPRTGRAHVRTLDKRDMTSNRSRPTAPVTAAGSCWRQHVLTPLLIGSSHACLAEAVNSISALSPSCAGDGARLSLDSSFRRFGQGGAGVWSWRKRRYVRRLLLPTLNVDLLRDFQSVVYFNAQILTVLSNLL